MSAMDPIVLVIALLLLLCGCALYALAGQPRVPGALRVALRILAVVLVLVGLLWSLVIGAALVWG